MSERNDRSTYPAGHGAAQWLIHHAACRAPPCLSARLEEEWLADLEAQSSMPSRLRFAAGCCWATLVIVNEHPQSLAPAPSRSATKTGVIALADRKFGYVSLPSGTLFLIVGLHVALFFGLASPFLHARGSTTPPTYQGHVVASKTSALSR
jgi:hypothetical protein